MPLAANIAFNESHGNNPRRCKDFFHFFSPQFDVSTFSLVLVDLGRSFVPVSKVVPYLSFMVSEWAPRAMGGDKTGNSLVGIVMEGVDSRRGAEAQ